MVFSVFLVVFLLFVCFFTRLMVLEQYSGVLGGFGPYSGDMFLFWWFSCNILFFKGIMHNITLTSAQSQDNFGLMRDSSGVFCSLRMDYRFPLSQSPQRQGFGCRPETLAYCGVYLKTC